MAFPGSPTDGQVYKNYVYNTANTVWDKLDPNKAFPIGFIYTQLPGKSTPATLGWYGTWTNKSSEFAGDFFRTEGGAATAFETGEQADQFQSHLTKQVGGLSSSNYTVATYPLWGTQAGSYVADRYNSAQTSYGTGALFVADGANGDPRYGSETRPINKSVRIWERTS